MKKLTAFVLSMMMLIGMSAVASADTVQLDVNTKSVKSVVSLTVAIEDSYIITIPARITIDPETKEGTADITLHAGCVLGGDAQKIFVKLAGAANGIKSGYRESFTLKETTSGAECAYGIYYKGGEKAFALADGASSNLGIIDYKDWNMIAATSTGDNSNDQTCTLYFAVSTLPKSGTYTDDEGAWTTTLEPTCTEDGTKELKCGRCGEVCDTQVIDKLGHSSIEGIQI